MRTPSFLPLVTLAGVAGILTGTAQQYLTPNTGAVAGGTVNGLTVTNRGLVGVGRMSGELFDSFHETMGASSSLAISGWSYDGHGSYTGTLNVLPDRGFGDGAYNYAARLHKVDFTFTPYTGTAAAPDQNQLQMTYASTTKFTYDDNGVTKFTSGLNPTGTGTLFGQTVGTVVAASGEGGPVSPLLAIDAEAIYLFPDGSGYMSDEYGTYITRFDANKKITGITQLPAAAQPHIAGALNFTAAVAPADGRRNNQGLEGMSVTPDGTRLFALLQSATIQDTDGAKQQTRNNARLYIFDISTPEKKDSPVLIAEHVVQLPVYKLNGNGAAADTTAAQSEILAVGPHQFLMLPRDGNGLGKKTLDPIVFKSVSLVDFSKASNILGQHDGVAEKIATAGVLDPAIVPALTQEVVNIVSVPDLTKFGINTNVAAPDKDTFQEKWEALSLVPDLATDDPNDYFLFVGNDNDFQSSNVSMLQADGTLTLPKTIDARDRLITNDATYLIFSVSLSEAATTYESFSATIADTALRGKDADPDGDGFSNLQEFLLGTSPVIANGSLLRTAAVEGGLKVSWQQRTAGGTYTLTQSTGLDTWTPVTQTPETAADQTGVTTGYKWMEVTVPVTGDKQFFRIEAAE
ncbi:MAG: outer rane autotransporter barrel domain protein [Akkermansiaceae bacterium]|nr:outer rane autotransporter barrel domain protein [Akkermansiaceae bacterium]